MTEQQQQQQQRSSSSTNGTDGRPPTKMSNTTGAKDGGGGGASKAEKKKAQRDRKKARTKQQKNNDRQQPLIKFKGGITDSEHLMYGQVIVPGGNMGDQFRILKKQCRLHCSSKGQYKLSSSISSHTILCQADFLSPMPDPILYSTKSTAPDGTVTLILTNPSKKEELKTIWGKTINNQIASWTKYEEFSKGLFETTIGQLHDKVLATCRQDKSRWTAIESDNDLIGLLQMVEKICTQNKAGKKVYVPYENIFTLEKCLSFKQRNDKTTTEFAAQVNVMYDSVIHQNGRTSFGESFLVTVLERHGLCISDYTNLTQELHDPYDYETRDLIVAMLILKNSNHDRARDQLQQ